MRQGFSICILLLIMTTLFGQSVNQSDLIVLDLESSFSQQEEVQLSKFIENIKYVPLETTPESIIGWSAHYEVTDEYIIVRSSNLTDRKILLFERKTGKFIREIGKTGRGPDEYIRFSFIPYDSEKKVLYAINSLWQLVVYDILGKVVEIIKVPGQFNKNALSFDIKLDDKIFVGYFINALGNENNKLVLFTKDNVVKLFPNYQALKTRATGVGGLMLNNNVTFRHDNKIYLLEIFSDTLFQVTKNSLIPRYYFKMGKYNVTWQVNATIDSRERIELFYMMNINENSKYLFLEIFFKRNQYLGFIDKKNNMVTFCKLNSSGVSGFKDDLSGLLDVRSIDVTENDEMIYAIQPIYLIKWLKENPEKDVQTRTSLPWIKNIDEFSNPIIAIGKFK